MVSRFDSRSRGVRSEKSSVRSADTEASRM